ncbi:substrate-binding domain-containing protein [Clavibacter tessellarius]
MLVETTAGRRDREIGALSGLHRQVLDGVIYEPLALHQEDADLIDLNVPLVMIGQRFLEGLADQVLIADRDAARAAVAHLVETGRRRIALVGVRDADEPTGAALRQRGAEDALAAAGIPLDPRLQVDPGPWRREAGAAAMARLLDDGVEARRRVRLQRLARARRPVDAAGARHPRARGRGGRGARRHGGLALRAAAAHHRVARPPGHRASGGRDAGRADRARCGRGSLPLRDDGLRGSSCAGRRWRAGADPAVDARRSRGSCRRRRLDRVVAMDRKPIPLGVGVMVPLVLGVICFSLVRSAWSLVLYAVLLIGLAVVHRAASRRPRR